MKRWLSSVWYLALMSLPLALCAQTTGSTGGGQAHDNMQPFTVLRYAIANEGIVPTSFTGETRRGEVLTGAGEEQWVGEIRIFAGSYLPSGWLACDGSILNIADHPTLAGILGNTYGGDGVLTFALPDLRGRAAISFGDPGTGPGFYQGFSWGSETKAATESFLGGHTHTTTGGSTGSTGGNLGLYNVQPFLAMTYFLPLNGDFYYLHELRLFAGSYTPANWTWAEGSLLNIADNPALFSQLGVTFGGDGVTTFGIPNTEARLLMSSGQGPGLSNYARGQMPGATKVTYTDPYLPSHTHTTSGPDTGATGGGQGMPNHQRSLVVRYYIAYNGIYPSPSTTYVDTIPVMGEIRPSAGTQVNDSIWAPCEGQILPISSNPALFSLLGTTYGGDGFSTFGLPDLRGRTPIGEGTGSGLTPRVIATKGGTETITLTISTMGSHNHSLPSPYPGTAGNGDLTVSNNGDGTVDLDWGSGCGTQSTGYAVYEGALGDFTSHALVSGTCDQAGAFLYSHPPTSGNRYFLISATDSGTNEEGGLGDDSSGSPRPAATATCMTTVNSTTCP